MATAPNRAGMGWGTRLLLCLALVLVGAAGAAWALARYDQAARFLGIGPRVEMRAAPQAVSTQPPIIQQKSAGDEAEIANLETRLSRVETAAQRVEG